jgi:hypothetical protein
MMGPVVRKEESDLGKVRPAARKEKYGLRHTSKIVRLSAREEGGAAFSTRGRKMAGGARGKSVACGTQ